MRFSSKLNIFSFSNLVHRRLIQIVFKDGSTGLFPYVWLRDCSLDPQTYAVTAAMKGRLHFMRDFDTNVHPLDVSLDKNANCLAIQWPGNVNSRYEQNWLQSRCPANENVRILRRQFYLGMECVEQWNRKQIESRKFRFLLDRFIDDDQVLHDFLYSVCVHGIAVLEGNGKNYSEFFEKIVQRIGFLQRNHFGEIFEVFPKPNASNLAYAGAGELPYHTDFPSLSDPPQLQMLHMANRAECGGGLSMFVDGFHIAKLMAQRYPEHYKLLTSVPLEFVEEGFDEHKLMGGSEERFDYDMVARHKTIKLDDQNRVVQVQFGNVMRSWFIDIGDPSLIQKIYDALKIFTDLCYARENQLIFPLHSGDSVLWANTRLLHARGGYAVVGVPARERRVIGCYFGWDTVKSRIRMLRDALKLAQNQHTL
ncbi:hypothetical protein niasHT_039855 [Heterodera trifolii]|uniref:TauD/TfdA-like domain-containing protein n=1 Tax=Heterodera trifolii TaxID=157864 RepID=A0ABD2J567_9BILA